MAGSTSTPGTPAIPAPEVLPPRRLSAVDVLLPAPVAAEEPDDVITRLLESDEHSVTQRDRDQFAELYRWKCARRMHEAAAKTLGVDIHLRERELLDRRIERGWHGKLPATVSDRGEPLQPYVHPAIYPKFRTDPDGARYGRPDVTTALPDARLGHLVVTDYDSKAFATEIRRQVKAWRAEAGETGVLNDRGELVDAHGGVLTDTEQADPTADILGIHPALRPYVEAVTLEDIRFSLG